LTSRKNGDKHTKVCTSINKSQRQFAVWLIEGLTGAWYADGVYAESFCLVQNFQILLPFQKSLNIELFASAGIAVRTGKVTVTRYFNPQGLKPAGVWTFKPMLNRSFANFGFHETPPMVVLVKNTFCINILSYIIKLSIKYPTSQCCRQSFFV